MSGYFTLLAFFLLSSQAVIGEVFNLKVERNFLEDTGAYQTVKLENGNTKNTRTVFVGLNLTTNEYFYDLDSPKSERPYNTFATFREDTNNTGWGYLFVSNNVTAKISTAVLPQVNDSVRAYSAGIAEGVLTNKLIELHYLNTLDGYCKDDPAYCHRLEKFIDENIKWMSKMIRAKRKTSPQWHHIGLFFEQLSGIADGQTGVFLGPRTNLYKYGRLYMMNLAGDLGDLEAALNKDTRFLRKWGGCSALVKVTKKGDIIAAHDTWSSYQSMLRIIKQYNLLVADKSGGIVLESTKVKFSSYPGYVTSLDDYYVTSKRIVIFETTFGNFNTTLWKLVQPINSVPTGIRSAVAARLAKTGSDWHMIFSKFNSGTYNNEWIVVDYNAWDAMRDTPTKTKTGVLTVSNQLPGFFYTRDYTARLLKDRYFASYNVPSMNDIFKLSNATAMVRAYGSIYNYSNCPRALIFARNQSIVYDLSSALKLMRYNNFKYDPLSRCSGCHPPYSGELAISARCDLNLRNGTYPFEMLEWRSHGGMDTKLTNSVLISDLKFVAQSGPTFDQLPPFQWSTSGMTMKDTPHYGQPDLWKFDPVVYE